MKRLSVFILVLLITSCNSKKDVNEVLRGNFVFRTLPQNDSIENKFNQKEYKEILILLHNNFEKEDIINHLHIEKEQYDIMINNLFGNELIKKKAKNKFVPACLIIDENYKNEAKKIVKPIVKIVSEIVIDRLPIIIKAYNDYYTKKKVRDYASFDEASFFILSNVLLNKWQMKNIEKQFIKSSPPQRGRKKFYTAIIKVEQNSMLPIFFNRTYLIGNKIVDIYDKSISKETTILNNLKAFNKSEELFDNLASIITKDLIENLNKQKPLLVKYYLSSIYREEISFREWLMWIYQFVVAEATNELVKRSIIKIDKPIIYLVHDIADDRLKN